MSATAQREYGLFVDGESAEGSESRELVEPATGEPLATIQLAGEADVDRAVAAARAAIDGAWGKTPATERSRLLHALADAIVANRKELAELETRNVGKAISSVKAELAALGALGALAVDEEAVLALGRGAHAPDDTVASSSPTRTSSVSSRRKRTGSSATYAPQSRRPAE